MFLTCWTNYCVEEPSGAFIAAQSGDRVKVPVRRIALLRQCGALRVTVVETVNGRCYYVPGMPDDIELRLEGVE